MFWDRLRWEVVFSCVLCSEKLKPTLRNAVVLETRLHSAPGASIEAPSIAYRSPGLPPELRTPRSPQKKLLFCLS